MKLTSGIQLLTLDKLPGEAVYAAQLPRLPPSGRLLDHLRLAPVVVAVAVVVVGRIDCLAVWLGLLRWLAY